jgi:hypothetical protein
MLLLFTLKAFLGALLDLGLGLLILVSVQVEPIYPRPSGQTSKSFAIGSKPG